ncbi:hypothetical protein OEZ85_012392 [Tetradesmus obliquus]|uniref:Plastid lipid-associated protein/fibrillin conserved domain-containing protein n=1 Tax=Tetradesmus obliquus TaxID=3088 RepID=A0ABY8TT94_TETOB|nr:hypothetical protein OEZ85_012392 [Tetradesmus obliquus]
MQLSRAPGACKPLARLCSSTRRICVVRATGTKPGSSNPVTQSLLDFFEDITEGARDGPRRRAAQLQERDVPDVTDIASKVHQAADAVEAAAANLQDMLGDASAAVTQAFGGLEGRVAGLKQQLLKGEKNVEAMVDEVVHVIGADARKVVSTLAGGDKQAADAAHAALDAAVAKAQKLRSDAKQGIVTAEHAAEEVVEIARAMLQEVQHLLTPKAAKTAGHTAVIAEKGMAMVDSATDVEALAVALDAQVTSLRAKAGQLQLQAASGSTTTSEAVKALLGQFSDALGAIEDSVAAGAASGSAAGGASSSLQAALQRCRKDAVSGARMVAEAAAQQDISGERAVQYLSSLLRQLAADVSSELAAQGKQQQAGAAATRGAGAAAPRAPSGFAASASGVSAAGLQDSAIVVASVDELELVLQDASSQSQVVRAAAKGFAAAEAAAASLQTRLPDFKQALAATASGGDSEAGRKAAARILTGAAGEVEGQLAELQAEMLARSGGGETGAAAAASLQLLRDSVETRVRQLAGRVEAGQVKPTAALDELLTSLQGSITGELRSCLLESLSQSQSASASASMSMSDDELSAQLTTAIADARKDQVVRAAAKGFAAAEATAASLQTRLPEFKQALAATTAGGDSESGRKAAARILTGAAGEVEGQLAELQREMLASSGGGEAGAAAAASLQLLRDNVETRVRQLAGRVEAGQVKPTAALDELLTSMQSSIAGELRSCLLDSLSQSQNASASASISMSEDELASQLATAIAAARKERAAAAANELEEAIAAGQLAAWAFKAAVGVGALQLVKSGAGMGLERAGLALPGALGGMLGVAGLLAVVGEAGAEPLVQFYDSYLSWTAGMLPLFYVPALAVVPSLLQGTDIPGLLGASLAGTAASLLFAALFASLLTKKPAAPDTLLTTSTAAAKGSSQQTALLAVAAFAAVGPLVLTKFDPTAFGQLMTVPVGLAWSLFGFLAGRAVGFNPMLLGAAAANAGVFWHGKLMGWGYAAAMDAFFGQSAGAGELLTAVVGMALTGLGVVIYKQRRSISMPAVALTAVAAAAFNVMSTVGATHLVPLTAVWCKAFVTRGIPTNLAPAVASSVGASPELAAIAVLLQAAVTVVLGSSLIKLLAGNNEAAAGIAAGCTAGGIGAAAVSQGQPAGGVALANGVLAYAAVHVLSAAMLGVPAVGEALQTAVSMAAA